MKRKNIMVIANSNTGGGAEIYMNILAEGLRNNNFHITRIDMKEFSGQNQEVNEYHNLRLSTKITFFSIIKAIPVFYRISRNKFYDCAIINCELPEFFATLIPRKVPLVIVEHTSNPWQSRMALGIFVRLGFRLRSTIWVKVSKSIKTPFTRTNKVYTIPNPIFKPIESKKSAYSKANRPSELIFIGRLDSNKNPLLFIEVCAKLNMRGKIIGDGTLKFACKKLSQNLGIDIAFEDFTINPWQHTVRHDIVIVPSNYEGDGRVVLEAIFRDMPLLVSDIPAFREFGLPEKCYVNDFTTLTIDFLSPLNEITCSPRQRHRLMKLRSPQTILDQWLKLLHNV